MQILKFVTGLLPNIEKRTILEDINNNYGELKTATLPAYKSAADSIGKYSFKNKDVEQYNKNFLRDQSTGFKGNMINVIYETILVVEKNESVANKLTDAIFSDDIITSSMTYRKANMLQYIEALSFFQRYSRKLLLWIYTLETATINDGDSMVKSRPSDGVSLKLTDGDTKWLKDNAKSFASIVNIMAIKSSIFQKNVEDIPDMLIDINNTDVVANTVGEKVDPFRMNFIPAELNLIYHVRMRIAEFQHERYTAALAERKALEIRLLHLENSMKGKQDPKLEQQIQYSEARLEKLNYKIKKMEEAYD
jgi:hypothetical protein